MARSKKTAEVAVMSAGNEPIAVATTTTVENTQKHVSLAHLYIIKEYIDKQADKTISSEQGFHGIRYYEGRLQAKDASSGNWIDIDTGGSGGGSPDIADDDDVKNMFS